MGNAKILVVDDRPSSVKVLRVRLNSEGYDVLEASDGFQALEIVEREPPDLVLLDVMMPKMDGYEVCRKIKGREKTRFLPVVLVTALSDRDAKITGIEAGADDFLNKPVDPSELRVRVRSLLKTKGLHDELEARYEELRKLQTMRESLTQMIVHDLRNPLAAVIGYLKLLKRKGYVSEEETAQRNLRAVDMCTQTLMDMITAMLDLAKLEAGEMQLSLEAVHLDGVLSDVEIGMRPLLDQKDLVFASDTPADLPPLRADRECLRRILVNTLGNAASFSPGGGRISVTGRQNGRYVDIAVKDEGPGIPPEDQARIFERFGQVECRQSGRKYSTGLGLAFCKTAAEAHNGEICVESEVGVGTIFTVRIPAETAP